MGSSGTIAIAQQLTDALFFCGVPDDLLVNILCRLDEDPRDLARVACVSTRFCKVIKTVCWKFRCEKTLPLLVQELLQAPSAALHPCPEPPGGWAALQKLLVCCPGLWHAGVLLENWDFGLDRDLGWFDSIGGSDVAFPDVVASQFVKGSHVCDPPSKKARNKQPTCIAILQECYAVGSGVRIACCESNVACTRGYGNAGGVRCDAQGAEMERSGCHGLCEQIQRTEANCNEAAMYVDRIKGGCCSTEKGVAIEVSSMDLGHLDQENRTQQHRCKSNKQQREYHHDHCHIATGPWNLSREQGNKLLANRFRADSLYICDWPGCLHPGDRRIYKLFRGVFKNFKSSHVWRNLKDMQAKATNVGCAFCVCKSTWDMVTTFCLKRSIEFHDDGEPVVRAYVCENGHVAGAWTDRPMYAP